MKKRVTLKRTIRWTVRLLFLVLAVFFAIGGPLPGIAVELFPKLENLPTSIARIFPGLSPLVLASSTLTETSWYAGLYWGLPPLAVLLLAVWKGRLFCRWVCPAGTAYAIPATFSMKKTLVPKRLSGIVFWSILGGAAIGMPLFIFLDPLANFNRATILITGTYTAASIIPGIILPLFLLLSAVQPLLWCTHFCPLGYCFDLVYRRSLKRRWQSPELRREVVLGLFIGIPLAFIARKFPRAKGAEEDHPVLPPGAKDIDTFAARCTRCYACVNACPSGVIRVGNPVGRRISQFFHPELEQDKAHCEEFCNECTQVCPAGALQPLTVDEKRHRQIGVAKVRREACLAWADNEYCMVCQEHCPYLAIENEPSPEGIPRPVVLPDICRGCGHCEQTCPAIRAGKAIIVYGVKAQKEAEDAF